MSTSRARFALLAASSLLMMFVLSSCGTTTMKASWRDESYKAQPRKVLIVGVAQNEGVRRFYETEFVTALKKHGVDGIPSYLHFPSRIDSTLALAKVQELGVDAILVTRLIDQHEVETYYPPTATYMGPTYGGYYGGWYGYYGYGMDVVTTPGYTTVEKVYSLETNIFDVATHKLIFSAISETKVQSVDDSVIKEVIDVVTNDMREKGLIT
jgi:hypothetical protein